MKNIINNFQSNEQTPITFLFSLMYNVITAQRPVNSLGSTVIEDNWFFKPETLFKYFYKAVKFFIFWRPYMTILISNVWPSLAFNDEKVMI